MSKTKRKTATKKCPIDNCWEQIPEHRHMCSACTSWWYRIQIKDASEIATYVQRVSRFTGRLHKLPSRRRAA